jgi:hypothetical protein
MHSSVEEAHVLFLGSPGIKCQSAVTHLGHVTCHVMGYTSSQAAACNCILQHIHTPCSDSLLAATTSIALQHSCRQDPRSLILVTTHSRPQHQLQSKPSTLLLDTTATTSTSQKLASHTASSYRNCATALIRLPLFLCFNWGSAIVLADHTRFSWASFGSYPALKRGRNRKLGLSPTQVTVTSSGPCQLLPFAMHKTQHALHMLAYCTAMHLYAESARMCSLLC